METDYDPTLDTSICECGHEVRRCECPIDDEDEWDPDAPDPHLVEHGLDKAMMGLSIALSATDDEKINSLLGAALVLVDQATSLNGAKIGQP